MCQRMGRPPISTIGLGRASVSSASRVPRPPASMTARKWDPPPATERVFDRRNGETLPFAPDRQQADLAGQPPTEAPQTAVQCAAQSAVPLNSSRLEPRY